jgi:hypothetical protein
MKKLSFSLLLIVSIYALSITNTKAQSNCSGVYLTANNFLAGKLYYAYTGKNESKASDYDLLTKKKIIIEESGTTHQIDKRDIYAIQKCNGKIIRIYKGGYYTLLNPRGNMPIYMVTQNPASKGDIVVYKYYFSKNANSEVKELTIENLETEFPDFHQFNNAMKVIYNTDKVLFSYIYADNNLPKTQSVYIKYDEK